MLKDVLNNYLNINSEIETNRTITRNKEIIIDNSYCAKSHCNFLTAQINSLYIYIYLLLLHVL